MDILHQTMKEGFHVTNHKSRIGMHLTLTFRVKHGFGADLTFSCYIDCTEKTCHKGTLYRSSAERHCQILIA